MSQSGGVLRMMFLKVEALQRYAFGLNRGLVLDRVCIDGVESPRRLMLE